MQSISKAWNYIKQNKWKVMGATAAVAGGLWYWTSRSTRNAQQEAHQKHSYWLDAQLTCDRTISAFAPMLLKRINEILKIPELLEDLRKPDLDKTEKINKWEQLKTATFAGTILSIHSLTILSVYLRVCVNIVGRYLYQSNHSFLGSSPGTNSRSEELKVLSSLSSDTQRKYLTSAEHLLQLGLPLLTQHMLDSASQVLKDITLRKECTYDDLVGLLTNLLSSFELQLQDVFHDIPGSILSHVLLPQERSTQFFEEDDALYNAVREQEKLSLLINETREILDDPNFEAVVATCSKSALAVALEELRKLFVDTTKGVDNAKLPVAKVVPILNKVIAQTLQPTDNGVLDAFSHSKIIATYSERIFNGTIPNMVPANGNSM